MQINSIACSIQVLWQSTSVVFYQRDTKRLVHLDLFPRCTTGEPNAQSTALTMPRHKTVGKTSVIGSFYIDQVIEYNYQVFWGEFSHSIQKRNKPNTMKHIQILVCVRITHK